MDLFKPNMDEKQVGAMSMLGLAHIGDAVYELLTRTRLCGLGVTKVSELHRMTVATVNAPAQAEAAQRILPKLTEEEAAIYRRGRNTKVNSVPQKADIAQYHAATGLEALFGWLYLLGRLDRIGELYAAGTGEE
ncbi:MAG: ribonuclease III domain-containing protein [Clostridia bacterium]|nr:ribonuclease III [Oscillospiraceae bacterium]MCI6972650.1 ribonuclease III [Clostridiales bacterium]MDO4354315.1 ribonuclease III domain-containing protein [Clostridia bacterium]MDY2910396.1 ribonuclease III domain-containing protein [Oscillospiraceae bacterium]